MMGRPTSSRTGLVAFALLITAHAASTQDRSANDEEALEVRITNVTARSVYIDKGRRHGIAPGDRWELDLPGLPRLRGAVDATSRSSARLDLDMDPPADLVGRTLTVWIRKAEAAKPPGIEDQTERQVPDHPPWSRPLEEVDPKAPLLAPAFGQGPAARPTRWRGSFRTLGTWSDTQEPASSTFLHAELSFRLNVDNPFGEGGELQLASAFSWQQTQTSFYDDETGFGHLDRLSYRYGIEPTDRVTFEVGRFFPREFPEFGLIDGADVSFRLSEQHRIGISAGAYPDPFRYHGPDGVHSAVSYGFRSSEEEEFLFKTAYQKTWTEGEQDRDLLISHVQFNGIEDVRLHASTWVDFYGANDVVKQGAELTQLQLDGQWSVDRDTQLGFAVSRLRWPELLREEYTSIRPSFVDEWYVNRYAIFGRRTFSDLRVDARLERWSDQDQEGWNAQLGGSLRDVLWERGDVSLQVFVREGDNVSNEGLRLSASKRFDRFGIQGGVERSTFTFDPLGQKNELDSTNVFANLDWAVTNDVTIHLNGLARLASQQRDLTVTLFVEIRF
ncbi:MAG: hypothetical protein H6834_15365 [Planctomycetes bacterium]|nr:hypothetical protein [Planctomycetota bacterium]